ncbi:DUF6777 domain-containing protein [Streptomyces apocyni]|uniref:DUF6777 domain-containing protein n=1 Tax=Streptomyces apocyni TaxID=2654677 RepID=UPI0012EA7568|nr:DUF6777 domain-containing protein [Streptomyces apocyni]
MGPRSTVPRRDQITIGSLLAAIVILVSAIGWYVYAGGDAPNDARGDGTGVRLEATGDSGPGPFVSVPDTDTDGVSSTQLGGGSRAGDSPGTFGRTGRPDQCDKQRLLKGLDSDPQLADTWARLRGIDPADIRPHIDGLTPVVLVRDTVVRNHSYLGKGKTSTYLSVLQAGVAILVDAYARPAVKCNCGNPLQPTTKKVDHRASYEGTPWKEFAKDRVATVEPRPEEQGPVEELTLVDPHKPTEAVDRPVGTDGEEDSTPTTIAPPTEKRPQEAPSTKPGTTEPVTPTPDPAEGAREGEEKEEREEEREREGGGGGGGGGVSEGGGEKSGGASPGGQPDPPAANTPTDSPDSSAPEQLPTPSSSRPPSPTSDETPPLSS